MQDRQETPEIDVEKVMEQIRENVRKRRQEFPPSKTSSPLPTDQVAADLTLLHRGDDIYPFRFASHRRVFGRFVVLAKKLLQQLLTPILERQLAYNTANTRVTSSLWEQLTTWRQQQATALQALHEQLERLGQQHTSALHTLRVELEMQGAGGQQQHVTLRAELGAQGAAVREQGELLQALRAELEVQVAGGQQQHVTLRAELGAQGAAVREQGELLQALRAELEVQVAAVREQGELLQALRAELEVQVAGGQQQVEVLHVLCTEVEKKTTEWARRLLEWERIVAQLKTENILQERRITLLLEEARKRLPDAWDQEQCQKVADEEHHSLDALYVSFEDQFRGTREDIKERLQVYLSLLQEAKCGSETRPILDVGCGRGEWLELLQEAGLCGQGVDRNRVLVEQCQRRGLRVVESDVLAYLRSVSDASVGAVTGFHIIEHLPLEVLIKLLDETVRILTSGGLAIFETPNPHNVLVGSHNFYLDPTHRNPLPSSVMQFMAEARGLCRVQIIELHPYPEASHVQDADLDVAKRFNEYFYGPQDYAVVGWKA